MTYIIIFVAAFLVGFYLAGAVVIYRNIHSFSVEQYVKLSDITLSSDQNFYFRQMSDWANSNGFSYVGLFQFRTMGTAVWVNRENSSSLQLILYFHPQIPNNSLFFVLSTWFDHNIILETGNFRRHICLPVPPGCYVQDFSKKSIEEVWELHKESIRYLTDFGDVHLASFYSNLNGNIEQLSSIIRFNGSSFARNEHKYLSSLPLYPLRWVYWVFYRPFFWANKTIREQVEMGRLVLPQALPPDYEKYFDRWSPEKKNEENSLRS
jgi:hypothetical protein